MFSKRFPPPYTFTWLLKRNPFFFFSFIWVWLHLQNTQYQHNRQRWILNNKSRSNWTAMTNHAPHPSHLFSYPKKSIFHFFLNLKTFTITQIHVPLLENVWRSRLSCQWYFRLPAHTQKKHDALTSCTKKINKQTRTIGDHVIQQVSLSACHLASS